MNYIIIVMSLFLIFFHIFAPLYFMRFIKIGII